jgi:hypothetical protein
LKANATLITTQDYSNFLKKAKEEMKLQEKAHINDMKRLRTLSEALQKKTG